MKKRSKRSPSKDKRSFDREASWSPESYRNKPMKTGPWTTEEDSILVKLVSKNGPHK